MALPDGLPNARLSLAIAGLASEEIEGFCPVDRFRGGRNSPGALQSFATGHFSEQDSHLDQRGGRGIEPEVTRVSRRTGSAPAGKEESSDE